MNSIGARMVCQQGSNPETVGVQEGHIERELYDFQCLAAAERNTQGIAGPTTIFVVLPETAEDDLLAARVGHAAAPVGQWLLRNDTRWYGRQFPLAFARGPVRPWPSTQRAGKQPA